MDIIVTRHETTNEWIVVANTSHDWKVRSVKPTLEQALTEVKLNLEAMHDKHQLAVEQIKRALINIEEKNIVMLKGDYEFFEFAQRSYLIRNWILGENNGDTIYCVIDGNGVWQDTQSDFQGALYFSEYHDSPSIVTARTLYAMWKKGLVS